MNQPMTITCQLRFERESKGRRTIERGQQRPAPTREPGRIPRVARLMALAIRFDEQVRSGVMASFTQLAELGHVTRARISQIVNLVNLAPDIQEAILHLPRTEHGRDPIHLRMLQPLAAAFDWRKQRRLWKELVHARGGADGV
jgi:hypothetical protein